MWVKNTDWTKVSDMKHLMRKAIRFKALAPAWSAHHNSLPFQNFPCPLSFLKSKTETPILWPPNVKNWFIGKYFDAGKTWRQEEKGMAEDEMVGWHYRHSRHGFGWTPGVGDGQGGLVYYSSWGRKELDMTEQLNWLTDFPFGGMALSKRETSYLWKSGRLAGLGTTGFLTRRFCRSFLWI